MANSSFADGVQFVFDATSIELAQTCHRKYYYQMIRNLRPNNTSVHLIFGGIFAKAMENFYKHRVAGVEREAAIKAVVHRALIESWAHERTAEGSRIPGTGAPLAFDHAAKTRTNLIRSIVWYLDNYADDEEHYPLAVLPSGEAAVEVTFKLDAGFDDILFAGHLDRLVQYGGHTYWMDQKTTTTALTSYYFRQFDPHNQFSMYTWAGQIILQSPVKGGLIDAARILPGATEFARQFSLRTRTQLEEWHTNVQKAIKRIRQATQAFRHYGSEGHFEMNLSACGNYGGCPFRAICSATPEIREQIIQGDYQTVAPWDPAKAR